ncbi:hypothetical protein GCM10027194_08010 [Thalassiella azotivora]
MAGVRPRQPARAAVLDRSEAGEDGGRGGLDAQAAHRVVQPREDLRGRAVGVVADPAQQAADLRHRRRGLRVVSDDVADHEHRRAVGLDERVVPVAADLRGLRGRLVAHRDVEVVGLRRRREEPPLQALREAALQVVQPGVLQRDPCPLGDLGDGGQVLRVQQVTSPAGEHVEQAGGPAVRPQRQQDDLLRGQAPQHLGRLVLALQHLGDPLGGARRDRHGLPGDEGPGDVGGGTQHRRPQHRVAVHEVALGGVAVPRPEVAQRAVVLLDGDDAPVRERRGDVLG